MHLHQLEHSVQAPIKTLIVEDNLLTRLVLKSFLASDPAIEVTGDLETAEEAIKLIQTHPLDVVLIDLVLSGPKNGLDLISAIRNQNIPVKIIVISSHYKQQEVMEALHTGANGYCVKENISTDLLNIIKCIHRGGMWLDATIAPMANTLFKPNSKSYTSSLDNPETLENTEPLTDREQEVLKLLVEGQSNTEIAQSLFISVHTAKAHVCNILQKLYVSDRVQAAVKAVKQKLV